MGTFSLKVFQDWPGTQIYRQSDGEFYVRKGPIFANIILADEINRAPAKVQSALLEAMQERQVTEERQILDRMASTKTAFDVQKVITPEEILDVRSVIDQIYIDDKIKDYVVDIVCATRNPEQFGLELKSYINFGASPRASIFLALAAKAMAFINGRGYVTPQDVKSIGMDVLRHRVLVSYEAEAEDKTSEDIIQTIFDNIEVP